MSTELIALGLGVAAVLAFPVVALSVHGWRERRHNRRMNRRKQDRHRML